MASMKLELNSSGIRDFLRGDDVQELVESRAEEIAHRCGSGYAATTYVGRNRANASVITETWAAYNDNLKNNTILKAVR